LLDPEGRSGKHPRRKEEKKRKTRTEVYNAKALDKPTLPLERRPS
jgi:hypothetical protein